MNLKSTITVKHRIWQHLIDITFQSNVTAILTTHYIDEARQANHVKLKMCLFY
jgi:ABC-type multidrug transport system ATPase subunit